MTRLVIAEKICSYMPPIISQKIRNIIFPRNYAIEKNIKFLKKSITGSIFEGETLDYHSYFFSVHGYFDWRNIVIAKILLENNSGDIIEIGANIGTETICFCDILLEKSTVHAFEPFPENLLNLNNILKNNKHIKNLKIYPFAVSDKITEVDFMIPPKSDSGTGKILQNVGNNNSMKVSTFPIDYFKENFQSVKLIFIDVEGHELNVLNGAFEVIKKFRPAIILEVSPDLLKAYSKNSVKDIYDYFDLINYSCFNIGRWGIKVVTRKEIEKPHAMNWMCVPDENLSLVKKIKKKIFFHTIMPLHKL